MKVNKILRSAFIMLLAVTMMLCSVSCNKNSDNGSGEKEIIAETTIITQSGETVIVSDKNDGSDKKDKSDKNNSKDKPDKNDKNDKTDKPNNNDKNTATGNTGNNTVEEDIYSTFHRYEKWTSASSTHHSAKCSDCGKTEKIAHIWNDGAVTTKPTTSGNGVLTFTCQICGNTKTEKISYTALYGDGYSAGRKTAETYQAASTREFKLYGAAYSDDNFCAVYGDCPVGVTVLAQSKDGCYAVDSSNGTFALRMESEEADTEVLFSLWYKGKRIGEPFAKSLNIYTSDYDNDDEGWKPMIGYDNQGYFEKILDCHTRERQITSSAMASYTDKYARRVSELKQISGGEIICVLAPSALTVYPETVPEKFKQLNRTSYYEQVATSLKNAGVTVLDLRDAFNKHKNDALPLYNKYDTHWTDYGAYIAYVEMYNHISKKFPAAAPRKFSEFKWVQDYFAGSDIPSYFGVDEKPGKYVLEYTVRRDMPANVPQVIKNINRFKSSNSVAYNSYSDEAMKKQTYKTGNSALPNVSVIKNSYGIQIQDIIAERSNVSVINEIWAYKFNTSQYKENKTDYVIYVLSEWEFDRITDK